MVRIRQLASSDDASFRLIAQDSLDLAYRVTPKGDRLVIPGSGGLRELLLGEMHDSLLSGHLGAEKTRLALAARVWWPKMVTTVREYVRGCGIC
jgi:hypothetical protein